MKWMCNVALNNRIGHISEAMDLFWFGSKEKKNENDKFNILK